eukprot:TRINITY_DN2902_c0_g1_i10.p1 TRINITY_DN2902_c0_g1~~TRINITY_DN2902_c0_g1_i10.p1  ORF type:complete len:147 (-),score=22.65 TRINITY_DN2902_c0_g1_i10:150-590(-)
MHLIQVLLEIKDRSQNVTLHLISKPNMHNSLERIAQGEYCIDPNLAGTLFRIRVSSNGLIRGTTIRNLGLSTSAGMLQGATRQGFNFLCHQPNRAGSTIREQTCYSWLDNNVSNGKVIVNQWYQSIDTPYRDVDYFVGTPSTVEFK